MRLADAASRWRSPAVTIAGRCLVAAGLLAGAAATSGCASLAASAASGFAENLSAAILEQDDPALVRDGTPAYLLLLDSLVQGSPDDPAVLGAATQLYAAYGTAFVTDPERARLLTAKAAQYGARALCAAERDACDLDGLEFAAYERTVQSIKARDGDALYSYCVGQLAFIRAHSADWGALTDLPKVELALTHLLSLEPTPNRGNVYKFLGILNTIRPPALGGQPERGREYFDKAIEASRGRDLSVKVEYARGYARLLYERELHDQLLNEVLASDPRQPGLTLFNSIAQQEAAELLASADEYF